MENDNIKKYEKPIAIELGQPYRENYSNLPMGNREKTYIEWGKGPERFIEEFAIRN